MWNMQNTIMPSSKCVYTFTYMHTLISFSRCCWKFMFFIHFYFISLLQNVTFTNDGWSRNSIYFGMELVRSVLCMTVFHHPIPWHAIFKQIEQFWQLWQKKNKEFPHAFHAHVWKYPVSKFKIPWIFFETYYICIRTTIADYTVNAGSFHFFFLGRPPEVHNIVYST